MAIVQQTEQLIIETKYRILGNPFIKSQIIAARAHDLMNGEIPRTKDYTLTDILNPIAIAEKEYKEGSLEDYEYICEIGISPDGKIIYAKQPGNIDLDLFI